MRPVTVEYSPFAPADDFGGDDFRCVVHFCTAKLTAGSTRSLGATIASSISLTSLRPSCEYDIRFYIVTNLRASDIGLSRFISVLIRPRSHARLSPC